MEFVTEEIFDKQVDWFDWLTSDFRRIKLAANIITIEVWT